MVRSYQRPLTPPGLRAGVTRGDFSAPGVEKSPRSWFGGEYGRRGGGTGADWPGETTSGRPSAWKGSCRGWVSAPSCTPLPPGWAWPDGSATMSMACSRRSRAARQCVEQFLVLLEAQPPPLARVDRVTAAAMTPSGAAGFAIVASDHDRPPPGAGLGRQRDLRRLPGRAGRPGRPAVRLPVHQLHQLRATVHHRHRRALRPAADHHGAVHHVRGVRGGVPRPGEPQVPRPAGLLPGLRAAAAAARPAAQR